MRLWFVPEHVLNPTGYQIYDGTVDVIKDRSISAQTKRYCGSIIKKNRPALTFCPQSNPAYAC